MDGSSYGWIGVGVGGLLLAIALIMILRTLNILIRGVSAEGTLVDWHRSTSDGSTVYAPIIDFVTAQGETVRIKDPVASSHRGMEIGERVPVRYLPNRPDKARMVKPMRLFFAPAMLIFFGGLALLIGLVVIKGSVTIPTQ